MKKVLSYSICTVFSLGYIPFAPGTFTSLLTVLLVFMLNPSNLTLLLLVLCTMVLCIMCSPEVEKSDGKDPQHIVIDEVSGQLTALLFLPRTSILLLIFGFLFFRLFDIAKPIGINSLQNLKSGWGVVMDDILAGIYTNIILQILILTRIL